ncbi:hypothetical protein AYO22_00615 [Fonsecaea multimorphosa]|nr:hypothetical protein AYO22_00615 [Fonsecaea multimorphosa]
MACAFVQSVHIQQTPKTYPMPSPPEETDRISDADPSVRSNDEPSGTPSFSLSNLSTFNNVLEMPESRSRRLLELRLLNHYSEHLIKPFPDLANSNLVTAWSAEVPRLSLKHDNLLYMMFSCAASHLLRAQPDDGELNAAADVYLGLALREQHQAVSKLSGENADAVCFAAMLLLITSVARLWRRPLEPYSPPMEWLRLGTGAGTVLRAAKDIFKQDTSSKMMLLINAPPVFDVKVLFAKENLKPFSRVLELEKIQHAGPGWDAERFEVLEKSLCYIGYLYLSVDEDEPVYIVARKIVSFAIFVPRPFVELVEEKHPCALVILAHYFALMARFPSVWWIGKTPRREVHAIHDALPSEWQDQMKWPMMMAGLTLS